MEKFDIKEAIEEEAYKGNDGAEPLNPDDFKTTKEDMPEKSVSSPVAEEPEKSEEFDLDGLMGEDAAQENDGAEPLNHDEFETKG